MKIIITTDTWSIECGDDDYYHLNEEFNSKLIFNCNELNIANRDIENFSVEIISNQLRKVTGKVIFKDEYLLIVDGVVRFGVILNNRFRFGNNNYVGNRNIDHTTINVGDIIEAEGYFTFANMDFCIFTYLPSEKLLPDTGHKWKVMNIYKIEGEDNSWDLIKPDELEKVSAIDTSSQTIYDGYAIEFNLVSNVPVSFEKTRRFNGFVSCIGWINPTTWISNCEGIIVNGVKKGSWYYFDKTGTNKKIFEYEA